ncbi:hypothetical protein BH24ACT23_BH24ACT23_07040 [soil metagenome]
MSAEPLISIVGAAPVWPLALSLAILLVAGERTRDRRRRRVLNERLHELRRPLQALALAAKRPAAGPDPLELALAAVRDLDREVNGSTPEFRRRPVEARMLALAAAERWRARAARAGRGIGVRWSCGDVVASADPVRVAQALDNLIANALEHGAGEITIEGARHRNAIDLMVRDRGSVRHRRMRDHGDQRHGHGLRITRALAKGGGGKLRPPHREEGGTVAYLVLPLADGPELSSRGPYRR